MKRVSSPDCASIGQSLKRVKISTSPGELRLDRDVEGLILGRQWSSSASGSNGLGPIDQNSWPGNQTAHPRGPSPSLDRRGRAHGELVRPDARLVRDPVDPLKLRLTYLHQPPANAAARSTTPLPPERWTFVLQLPRMYPHVPPVVTRVTRDFVPSAENNVHTNVHGWGVGHDNCCSHASAAMVASSVMQSQVEPPVPEQILIQQLPPTPGAAPEGAPGDAKLLDIDVATAVFGAWSPVSSLQDLLDFLMAMPARRRQWWSVEANRSHHQQQLNLLEPVPVAAAAVGQPTLFAPSMTSFSSSGSFEQQSYDPQPRAFQQFQNQQQQPMSPCRMEAEGEMHMVEMMEDVGDVSVDTNHFRENRFDVGYDRGGMRMQS
ncbi:hypothetical protein ACHAXT_007012 [Thalassiosira profunda]